LDRQQNSRSTEKGFTALLALVKQEMALGLRPQPRLTLDEWADKYRRLNSQVSAIGGKWRTSRVEVARGPMRAVTEPGVRKITIMCCTQLMKTSVLENVIGYHTHLNPCPMLLTQPKQDAVKTFAKEKLAPMVRATPVLQELMADRARGGHDTINFKEFPGGFLALESAGSPTNLAMRAIRITLADEIDKYETTKEGDPVILLEERTATFGQNALSIRTCSPTWEETSRIWKSYQQSDMRKPYVACPHCGLDQTLDFFRHVDWPKGEEGEHFTNSAAISCEGCGAEWSEAERLVAITTPLNIKWNQTRPFICCETRQEPVHNKLWAWDEDNLVGRALCKVCNQEAVPNHHAGFQAGKLYSPFNSIVDLADKWITCKDDPESKQTFYNTQLGLPFSVQATKAVAPHVLLARCETYPAVVPVGVACLTAGIDVQSGGSVNEGRLECEVVGWGRSDESWSIEHKVFNGNPAKPEVWAELDAYLLSGFDYERGGKLAIRAACVDSGGNNTQDVYNFCRQRVGRNIWAIKGANDRSGQWSPVWPAPNTKPEKFRTGWRPIMLGVNAAKEAIRNHLNNPQPGPGFAHFPVGRTEEYFEQMTAESLVIEKKDGFAQRKWILKKGHANEALDIRVYAYAALQGLLVVRRFNIEHAMEILESMMPNEVVHNTDNAVNPRYPTMPPSAPAPRSRVSRSNWMR
jgi:phage terminase large subunit GpA-like protein